jgi:hypothetical protein
METTNKLLELLKDLAEQLPSLLTILACMVFAIVRWKRYPKVALVVLVGLCLLLLHAVVFAVVYTWVPDLFIRSASYPTQASVIRIVYLVLGLITNASLGAALSLLLAGIFIQRPSTNHE